MAILGVIADDFTGATDIAGMLVKNGMRTIQTIGIPAPGSIADDVDAVGVALKSRSIPAADAIAQSLAAPPVSRPARPWPWPRAGCRGPRGVCAQRPSQEVRGLDSPLPPRERR